MISTPVMIDRQTQIVASAICREKCAQKGEPPCSILTDKVCDECDGCARAVLAALTPSADRVAERIAQAVKDEGWASSESDVGDIAATVKAFLPAMPESVEVSELVDAVNAFFCVDVWCNGDAVADMELLDKAEARVKAALQPFMKEQPTKAPETKEG